MCTNSVRPRSPPAFDSHGRNTLNHNRPHRLMCRCIGGRSSLVCPTVHFSYKIQAMAPNTPNPCYPGPCDPDCMASIGNDIYWKQQRNRKNGKERISFGTVKIWCFVVFRKDRLLFISKSIFKKQVSL